MVVRASGVLSDLPAFSAFKDTANQLKDRLGAWGKEQFQQWRNETLEQLSDGDLALEMTGRLMEFDTDGYMRVNYSEKLVVLLREVRQLAELAMSVPDKYVQTILRVYCPLSPR